MLTIYNFHFSPIFSLNFVTIVATKRQLVMMPECLCTARRHDTLCRHRPVARMDTSTMQVFAEFSVSHSCILGVLSHSRSLPQPQLNHMHSTQYIPIVYMYEQIFRSFKICSHLFVDFNFAILCTAHSTSTRYDGSLFINIDCDHIITWCR